MSITCPICGRTSWHPTDVEEGWCGACHGATSLPPPPGFRWVLFEGGGFLDHVERLIQEDFLSSSNSYEVVQSGDRYVFDGHDFVFAPA